MKPTRPAGEAAPGPEDPTPRPAAEARVLQAFAARFGSAAPLLVRAPGRVNLLGEHTDYNDGFVLPMAIDRSTWIALRPRQDEQVLLHSLDFDEDGVFELGSLRRGHGWLEYVKATAWALQEAGLRLRGWEGVVAGDIPMGAGLSSSAALEIVAARAFAAVSGFPWEPVAAARLGQRAENGWVGVQCGIMDQLIVAAAQEGHALLIDCRSLELRPVPLPPATAVAVLDTATRRGLVDSAYNRRRAQCEEAARLLGRDSLRDVELHELERRAADLPEIHRLLARHVVTENARTLAAAEAMGRGDAAQVGRLMVESHRSLRDDFGVSSDALDAMVAAAREAEGCYGARMTGAGFGGCAVALVAEASVESFTRAVGRAYRLRTGLEPTLYVCRPSAGASASVGRAE